MAGTLTWKDLEAVANAAIADALGKGWPVSIAIVDEGGHLRSLTRLDNAIAPSAGIATAKARTAALYRLPSGALEAAAKERPAMGILPDALALEGGLPIMVDGAVVGGIGVSGMQSDQDLEVANAGLGALGA